MGTPRTLAASEQLVGPGDRLARLRELKRLPQREVAAWLGVSTASWSRYESGMSGPPCGALLAISKFFCAAEDFLLAGGDHDLAEEESLYQLRRQYGVLNPSPRSALTSILQGSLHLHNFQRSLHGR